jgi:hypothetical protein
MAWKRLSIRSRSGPPINPLQIKWLQEAGDLLPLAASFYVKGRGSRFEALRRLPETVPA